MSATDRRQCEVRMEDRTWRTGGLVLQDKRDELGHAALVRFEGITAWIYREQGRGRPSEWRYPHALA